MSLFPLLLRLLGEAAAFLAPRPELPGYSVHFAYWLLQASLAADKPVSPNWSIEWN